MAAHAVGDRGPLPGLLADSPLPAWERLAALALTDRQQRVIGALGMAWPQAQPFTEAQKSEVRVVARLAARRPGPGPAARGGARARQRTERLQAMMTRPGRLGVAGRRDAAVFQHGLLPFGASAARLVLVGQEQLGAPVTVNAVGLVEPALTGVA